MTQAFQMTLTPEELTMLAAAMDALAEGVQAALATEGTLPQGPDVVGTNSPPVALALLVGPAVFKSLTHKVWALAEATPAAGPQFPPSGRMPNGPVS